MSASAKMVTTGPTPGGAIDAAKAATQAGAGLMAWQRQRKLALISKPLRQKSQAKSFENDLVRLFGSGLTAWDLDLLDRLQTYGQTH